MSGNEPGLRERKRRATRRTIQQAAIRLALECGLTAVTVDEISRRADISPRTFFNYFQSKEQALLGDEPTLPDDDAVDRFVEGGPTGHLVEDLSALMAHSTQEMTEDRELLPERHMLLKDNPQLFGQRMASMKEFHVQLAAVMVRRLEREDPVAAAEDPATVERRARLLALIALATIRHAWAEWSTLDHTTLLVDCVESSFAELATLVSRTLV